MHRRLIAPLLAVGLAAALTGCLPTAGSTKQVVEIDSRDVGGWHFDYFENRAYPCSIRGYQTFAIGTKIGSSASASRPLWVKMRGAPRCEPPPPRRPTTRRRSSRGSERDWLTERG